MNIWLLTNTPSPYQIEFFTAIGASGRCRLHVDFMSGVHRGKNWEERAQLPFEYRFLRGFGPRWWSDAYRIHPEAISSCAPNRYDFHILSGQYTSLTFQVCARRLRAFSKNWAVWLEPPWPEDYRPAWSRSVSARNPIVRHIRKQILSRLLKNSPAVFAIGSMAAEAYLKMGARPDRIFTLPYYCDTDRYQQVSPEAIDTIRSRYGLANRFVFLYSGQMIERKGVDALLDAFARIALQHKEAVLLLLGDGSRRGLLQSSVPESLRDRVIFAGHVESEELPAYFRSASAFVFPSRHDGWGIVINEACAAGLPVIATRSSGAARDLVRDGENGFLAERDNTMTLTDRMTQLLDHPNLARDLGARSLEVAQGCSLSRGVDRFFELIDNVKRLSNP